MFSSVSILISKNNKGTKKTLKKNYFWLCKLTKTFDITTDPQPLVSLLTVNFNQVPVTLQLVESLSLLSYKNWELVVVNNGPLEATLQKALENKPGIKLVNTGSNLGFAGGNNFGLPYCSGKYILFLNNDTEVTRGLLEPLVSLCENDPEIGMVSPKILFYDNPQTIQYAGATDLNEFTMRNSGIGSGEEDRGQYDKTYPTGFIHGAAMLVPRAVIDKTGPMYKDYFLYYEEYDWCYRIRKAGFKIFYCGMAKIFHKESQSTGVESPLKVYYLTRNRLLFARRNFTGLRKWASLFFFTLVSLPVHIIRYTFKRRFDLTWATLKGWAWNIFHTSKAV